MGKYHKENICSRKFLVQWPEKKQQSMEFWSECSIIKPICQHVFPARKHVSGKLVEWSGEQNRSNFSSHKILNLQIFMLKQFWSREFTFALEFVRISKG